MYSFESGPPERSFLPLATPTANYSTFYDSSPLENTSKNVEHATLPTYEEAIRDCITQPVVTHSPHYTIPTPYLDFPETPDYKPLPSDIEVEISKKGASSSDPWLNSSPELLKSFFYSNNSKPRMWVDIQGYEIENLDEEVRSLDSEGNMKTTTESRTNTKYHFELSLEVTHYIANEGFIHCNSTDNVSDTQSITDLFEAYVKDVNKLKTFKIEKEVMWDREGLTKAITSLIRSRGFRHFIHIAYRLENNVMKVTSNSQAANCLSHPLSQALCVLSCLCIFAWPIAKFYRKTHGRQLRSSFPVTITPEEWYQKNNLTIVSAVDNSNPF